MVGDVVQRFTASDDDLGVNAALQYFLEQTEPNGDTNVRILRDVKAIDVYHSTIFVMLLFVCRIPSSFINILVTSS